MSLILDAPPAVLEVLPEGGRWRLRSSDNLFSGIFMDRRTALRHAEAEADSHPGHVVIVTEG
ncbi:hypothetical protein [Brevundimonas sp.]|uniref:hypothetical protein n=1 Tax=Brevundimonas sp. TaxID=1871086 RepID=UPI003D0B6107